MLLSYVQKHALPIDLSNVCYFPPHPIPAHLSLPSSVLSKCGSACVPRCCTPLRSCPHCSLCALRLTASRVCVCVSVCSCSCCFSCTHMVDASGPASSSRCSRSKSSSQSQKACCTHMFPGDDTGPALYPGPSWRLYSQLHGCTMLLVSPSIFQHCLLCFSFSMIKRKLSFC